MAIEQKPYGTTEDGKAFSLFTLTNAAGVSADITNLGGAIVSLRAPDRRGAFADVALGYGDPRDYLRNAPYFGVIIGRYANRIEGASFELNGKRCTLAANNGANHLHGGPGGFHKAVWAA